MTQEGIKRADKRASITILVLGDEGVGKSSLISSFVSRYFSEIVPGIMTRVRLPPDPETACVTTIVDSQGGDTALLNSLGSSARLLHLSTASTMSLAASTEQGVSSVVDTAAATTASSVPTAVDLSSLRTSTTTSTTASSTVAKADSIILVYDLDRVETFFRLENHWLPLIERCYNGKIPVIVAENKVDLYRPFSTAGMSDEQALARKRHQMVSLMQRFPFVRQCIKCSAKNLLRVDDVFLKAQQAVIYPFTPPLYDLETGQLTVECQRAFTRIFRMYDEDHDGLLSNAELYRFQSDTYHVSVFERDLTAWKKVVVRNNPDETVLVDGNFTVAGFLAIFDVFISQNRLDVVWQALRKFGYDDDLNLHVPESVISPSEDVLSGHNTAANWRLTSSSKRFLSALFYQFDSNKDGILSPEDILRMFSILPPPALPPWHPTRASELFQNCFSKPIDSSLAGNGGGGSGSALLTPPDSPTTNPRQSFILPPDSVARSLSNSGISILSAGDSLPTVNSPLPMSRPLTFLEWMGYWHVVATISPVLARSELFKLGHVEEPNLKPERGSALRWKATPLKKKALLPADYVYEATLRSREIRVLVLGNRGAGKTALLNYLRGNDPGPQSTDTITTIAPETSTTHARLKRKLSKGSTEDEAEEFIVHLIFTDVPETAASSQEAHFRNLAELFGSSIATSHPNERMCDLAMLVFDCSNASSFTYVKELERSLLNKKTPRVFVGTKADLSVALMGKDENEMTYTVLDAANAHCQDLDLESPLIMSAERASSNGTDRAYAMDHLARCGLKESGVKHLRSRPLEVDKHDKSGKGTMMWLGKMASLGVVVVAGVVGVAVVGVRLLLGSSKKETTGSRWYRFFFNAPADS